MMLYEEGHFRLEDPVSRFIPEWKGMKVLVNNEDGDDEIVPASRPVTIHHLLTHTFREAVDSARPYPTTSDSAR